MDRRDSNRRIDYVEFAVVDIGRSKAFYGEAFGWTFTDYGPSYCEFNDGRMTGGFAQGSPRPGGPLVILFAEDLADLKRRIEKAGTKIVEEPYAFPGGRRFHFEDPDGYELAVWSDK